MSKNNYFKRDTRLDDPDLLRAMNAILAEKGLPTFTPDGIQKVITFEPSPSPTLLHVDGDKDHFGAVLYQSGALGEVSREVATSVCRTLEEWAVRQYRNF